MQPDEPHRLYEDELFAPLVEQPASNKQEAATVATKKLNNIFIEHLIKKLYLERRGDSTEESFPCKEYIETARIED